MGIAIFFLLALMATGAIVYPLFSRRPVSEPRSVVTDGDIEQAVRNLRRARSRGGPVCKTCGKGYQEGDRFCVRCGSALAQAAPDGPACPSCGATLHEDDLFCAKCGYKRAAEEVA